MALGYGSDNGVKGGAVAVGKGMHLLELRCLLYAHVAWEDWRAC